MGWELLSATSRPHVDNPEGLEKLRTNLVPAGLETSTSAGLKVPGVMTPTPGRCGCLPVLLRT